MNRHERRVVCVTPAAPDYLPPLALAQRCLIAGPYWGEAHRRIESGYQSIEAPIGVFDARLLLESGFRDPTVATVTYTVGTPVMPRNLVRLGCSLVLIAGDTHHGMRPLQELIRYAYDEPFGRVLTANNPQHVHWFVAAGLPRPGWWPCPDVQFFGGSSFDRGRRCEAIFIGQVGRWHPRRGQSIAILRDAGLPTRLVFADAKLSSRHYRDTQLSLNLTLNGDTNARVMEILAAGGCLVTDRLAPQAGINALFTEGEHFIGFEGDQELAERVSEYLSRPAEALDIARHGHQEYVQKHLPECRVEQFWEYFEGKSDELERLAERDRRVAYARRAGKIEWPTLLERLRVYEYLQEQVRTRGDVRVIYLAAVAPVVVADSADLSRLHRAFACFPEQEPSAWDELSELGVSEQVVPTRIESVVGDSWDLIVIGSDDFVEPSVLNLLTRITSGRIAIIGNGKPIPPSRPMLLAQLGWSPDPEWPSLHVRLSKPAVPEVDAIAPVGVAEFHSSPAPVALGRERVSARTSVIEDESPSSSDTLALAHDTVAKFDWQSVAQYLPLEMNALVSTGIVRSLVEARPVDGRGHPIPAFVRAATDFVEPLLRPEWQVLFWGSGADLNWWSARVAKVTAILAPGTYEPAHVSGLREAAVDVRIEDAASLGYSNVSGINGRIDVAVIGGEEPARCADAVLGKLSDHSLVIVENADRAACAGAIESLRAGKRRRIDFWGILPQYLFQGCTSVFVKDDRYVNPTGTPDTHQSTFGSSFAQLTGQ
jgi:hypothetical protein